MNAFPQSSFRPARRVRIAGVCALLMAGLLLAPSPAAAQLSRAGVTKQLVPGALLFGDVAHDPRNDVYLSVMAWGPVFAAFANSGGDVISTLTAGPALPGGFANNPRVAYGPDLNGGAGGFLVTWHESTTGPNFVHSAVVSYPGGVVAIDPGGVTISGGALSTPNGGGPSIAYSPEAKKFLVTWTGDGWTVKGRLVNGVTGVPEGGVITVGPPNTHDPAVAWNPGTQEFGVGFAGFGAYMALARVNTAAGVIPASGPFGQSTGTYNTALAVNAAGRYVLGWAAPGGAFSMELDATGTPLASFPTLISSQLGTPTSFAFALNPVSGTILAVSEGVGTREVPGVEMNSSGLPLGVAVPLTDGAGAAGAGGSYAPRVGARQTGKQWSISYSRYTVSYSMANQIVSTGSGAPAIAAPTVTQNPAPIVYARPGGGAFFTASATGGPMPSVQWEVKPPGGTAFIPIPGGTGTTLGFTAQRSQNGSLIRAHFTNFTNTVNDVLSTASTLIVAPGPLNDIDGDGRSDALVWRPLTGTWFWLGATSNPNASKQWGTAGDMSLTGDIDGDGVADLVIWRPSIGTWFWLTSSTSYDYGSAGRIQWGAQGDVPMLADVDGDGKDDLIVWRAATGTWYWLTSTTGFNYASARALQWGAPGDSPLTGDFDGDGKADLVVWRPISGVFFWLTSTSGYSYAAAGTRQWGIGTLGDTPFIGDIDGDHRADLVVWRATNGTWYWLPSSGGYNYAVQGQKQWGSATVGDVPMLADVDGDGRSDLEVWRSTTGDWFWLTSSTGYNYANQGSKRFGIGGDVPIVR